jgi:cytochrome oxidase Cu insertion factor (SCO1/SenC/PrrC family)
VDVPELPALYVFGRFRSGTRKRKRSQYVRRIVGRSAPGNEPATQRLTERMRRLLLLTVWAAILIAALPFPAQAHGITLVDQRGRAFAYESLRGSTTVLTFVSAHCTDACPIEEAELARCVAAFDGSPLAVRFLTVTLDPERDHASDMTRLARAFDADPARWIFASGSIDDVHRLMRSFHVAARRDARGYASAHTSFVYVLDDRLHLRRVLLSSSELQAQLLQGLNTP